MQTLRSGKRAVLCFQIEKEERVGENRSTYQEVILMRRLEGIGVRLDEDTRRRVRLLAAVRDCTITDLVTAILREALDRAEDLPLLPGHARTRVAS